MKEIKSKRYLRKEAIYSDMPIGDPSLPGNLTERDIPGGIDSDEVDNRQGETEAGDYLMYYTYSYDYIESFASNIRVVKAKQYSTRQVINDPNVLEELGEIYENQIRNDIEIGEEDAKLERSPDYNPFEE